MSNDRAGPPRVLALHGFALGGAMFAELAELLPGEVISPDLPGHGGRDATNTQWADAVTEVCAAAAEARPDVVAGYSMGGRLALAAALSSPVSFPRLVLISTSPGIADPIERTRRRSSDAAAAAEIEAHGLEPFLAEFENRPMLQARSSTLDLAGIRRANRPAGVAGALRGMGQGAQPYLGGQLDQLEMPVLWTAGTRDGKYLAIARRCAAGSPLGSFLAIDSAHNSVAERPAAVARAIIGT